MKIDFFKTECTEAKRTDKLFGICDDDNEEKAYTDLENSNKWIAIVMNKEKRAISFTAIDNCIEILKEETNQKDSTCDGMLTFEETIYLVELKSQRNQWKSKAIQQLENTVKLILKNHSLSDFKYKKAFACNKKHPRFATIDNELNKRFFRKYGFRIHVQGIIKIN